MMKALIHNDLYTGLDKSASMLYNYDTYTSKKNFEF